MPPAVLAAGVAAAGGLTSAVIGSRASNRAAGSQERALNQQIQLERERDAARGQRYQTAMDSYNKEKAQYDQIRRSLLGHYGINFGDQAGGGAPAAGQQVKGGMSLGDLVSRGGEMTPMGATPAQVPGAPEPMTGGDAGDVFDWRNYGVSR